MATRVTPSWPPHPALSSPPPTSGTTPTAAGSRSTTATATGPATRTSTRYVSVGQRVVQGQKLGAVGNTGGSYGAHLHYEHRLNGNDVRPRFNGSTVAYGSNTYTSRNCGGGSTTPSNPQSISDACGSGYKVIDSKAITGAKVYLTYSSSTGKNCVATLKTSKIGTKSPVSAFLQVSGGTRTTDSGSYGYYAGPVKKAAAHKCVKWGGSAGTASYTSPFEHCG